MPFGSDVKGPQDVLYKLMIQLGAELELRISNKGVKIYEVKFDESERRQALCDAYVRALLLYCRQLRKLSLPACLNISLYNTS